MIFDALGSLALGEFPIEVAPAPVPVAAVPRWGGGKLIAAYTVDDNGRLKRDMAAFIEKESQEDEAIMTALLAYWRNRE